MRRRDGRVLEPLQGGWHRVQRRERVHADGYVPGGHLHGREQRRVSRARPVPRRRHLQPVDGRVLEPGQARRDGV